MPTTETKDERRRRLTRARVARHRARKAAGKPSARPIHVAPENRAGRVFTRWSPCAGRCPLYKGEPPAHEQPDGGATTPTLPRGHVPARDAFDMGHRPLARAIQQTDRTAADWGAMGYALVTRPR